MTVSQQYERLPQDVVDRVIMRSFITIFSAHYKTTAMRAAELTVTTLAGVSRAWWKAVIRFDVSDSGRALKKQTRRKIDSK